MKNPATSLIFAILILQAACATTVIRRHQHPAGPSTPRTVVLHALAFGLLRINRIPPPHIACPDGRLDRITLRMNGLDVAAAVLTLGLYVPRHAEILCSPAEASVQSSPETAPATK